MNEKEFPDYYNYHLNYCLENSLTSEENFFRHVWQIVQTRVKHLEMQDPFSSNHGMHKQNLEKLQQFRKCLASIDEWNARPANIGMVEKNELVQNQKHESEKLNTKLAELNEYEVSMKILIDQSHVPIFIDIMQQLRVVQLPSVKKLLKSDLKSRMLR